MQWGVARQPFRCFTATMLLQATPAFAAPKFRVQSVTRSRSPPAYPPRLAIVESDSCLTFPHIPTPVAAPPPTHTDTLCTPPAPAARAALRPRHKRQRCVRPGRASCRSGTLA
eukprot:363588-Chlamydomonas_euryale.AAC.10